MSFQSKKCFYPNVHNMLPQHSIICKRDIDIQLDIIVAIWHSAANVLICTFPDRYNILDE